MVGLLLQFGAKAQVIFNFDAFGIEKELAHSRTFDQVLLLIVANMFYTSGSLSVNNVNFTSEYMKHFACDCESYI